MAEKLFIIRTGILGSAPSGFYEQLADEHNAVTHSAKRIKPRLSRQGLSGSELSEETHHAVIGLVVGSLTRGANVFNESYLNHRDRRREMRKAAAAVGGVRIVHLVVRAPDSVIRERIADRHRAVDEYLELPETQVAVLDDLRVSHKMLIQAQWPNQAIEPHLALDGSRTTGELLTQVGDYVAQLRQAPLSD